MALTYTEAQTVSDDNVDSVIKQQIYQSSPFMTKLEANNEVVADGGNQYTFPIRYQELGHADATDPDAQFVFEKVDTRTKGVLPPRFYKSVTMLTWLERITNSGKEQVVDLIVDKSEELTQDMKNRWATDLYTTNPRGDGFISLDVIVDDAVDYAGIAVGDAAAWAATVDDAEDELTLYGENSLTEMKNACKLGQDYPNFHLTTNDLASKFESLVEPQKRYPDKMMANAGFDNCSFHGAPVFGDYHCPAGYWYGLCLKKGIWQIRYHPKEHFAVSKWEELKPQYPKNLGKYVTWVGNLICKCRYVNFKFTALDYTI